MHAAPVVIVLVPILLAACASGDARAPASDDQRPPSADAPCPDARASATDGVFRLELTLPRSTWAAADVITGAATLSVVAPGTARIGAAGTGPIAFGFVEVDGTHCMGPASRTSCAMYTVARDAPITQELVRSGGWSRDDPDATFYASFFHDRDIHLTPGTWDVSAVATFGEGGCGADTRLTATVRIEVTE